MLPVLLAVAAAALVPALAACGEPAPDTAAPFVGYWRVPDTEVGGAVLIRIAHRGDEVEVTGPGYYFGDCDGSHPFAHTAHVAGTRLVVDGLRAGDGPSVTFTSTASGELSMSMLSYGECDGHNPMTIAPADGTAAQLGDELARQLAVEEGVRQIAAGVCAWTAERGSMPWGRDVRPGTAFASSSTVRTAIDGWPLNPFTGEKMRGRDATGDYRYETDHRRHFTIHGRLPLGAYVYVIVYPHPGGDSE